MDTKAATAATINPTIVDAKGDLIAATAADTVSRLAVGANGTSLVADSTTATGLKWAAPGAGALTYVGGAAFSAVATVSAAANTFSATYANYLVMIDFSTVASVTPLNVRLRAGGSDTAGTAYYWAITGHGVNGTTASTAGLSQSFIQVFDLTSTTDFNSCSFIISLPQLARRTKIFGNGFMSSAAGTIGIRIGGGLLDDVTQYDAFTFFTGTGNFAGTYRVYGIANS
jgi:hypothetical protein